MSLGDCYEAAVDFLMQHGTLGPFGAGDPDLILVHGEVTGQGPLEGVKYGHAWVETPDGLVIDVSNGRAIRLPIPDYYALARMGSRPNVHKYTQQEVRRKLSETGHYGAWDLQTESGF